MRVPQDIAETIVNPTAYADSRIFDAYAWLRANKPLAVAQPEGFDPFWVVTRHADILEISRQNDLFHSGDLATTITSREVDARVRKLTGGSPHLVRSLVQMDAPDHPKYRALTQAWFMPQNIKKLEERIRAIARAAVERMVATGGECDFVREIALHYPLHVVMEILGVPEADEPRMLMLTQELFGAADPELGRTPKESKEPEDLGPIQQVIADFYQYFAKISADRRAHPTGDLATVIANSQIDGQPISEFEAMSYYVIVATAGHDTTSSTTGGAMWALCDNPDQLAWVKEDLSRVPGLIDEAIRWTTPVKTFMRSATADAEVGGQKIGKGDWLMLCYASGNRDETVFDEPNRFRADRSPNKQLAFGYGAHLCLGQHLAKMEMRILYEELLPRIKSVRLNGEPKMSQAVFVNGPKTLPIAFELA
ncbi:cytochrome P450 [Phenylobacterium montanum]|uniref:Cytochrome P450 n=1 Tax=Phenylobacterium montanum TaxID=2823693 RepID=A0A975IU97_9CAUL|nr:cytochrome P450 [Caulobacter sp. S6]QUD87573.1 cytochrome P450 [Caulobacter sp. S6]